MTGQTAVLVPDLDGVVFESGNRPIPRRCRGGGGRSFGSWVPTPTGDRPPRPEHVARGRVALAP